MKRGMHRRGQMGGQQRCEQCARASMLVQGAKCALHESSTSPSVDRRVLDAVERPVVGPIGPVPFMLAGGRVR